MDPQKSNPQPNPPQAQASPTDVKDNKALAIIGYLGILCLLPLLLAKESKFAQFHGKQGLILLLAWVVVSAAAIIPILGWIAAFFGNIACFVLMLVGMINATRGEMKGLPWIGHYAEKIGI